MMMTNNNVISQITRQPKNNHSNDLFFLKYINPLYLPHILVALAAAISLFVIYSIDTTNNNGNMYLLESSSSFGQRKIDSGVKYHVMQEDFGKDATFTLELAQVVVPVTDRQEKEVTTTLVRQVQKVTVMVKNKVVCPNPHFWIHITGDALINVHLVENNKYKIKKLSSKSSLWTGYFETPIEGHYQVDARWYGCDDDRPRNTSDSIPLSNPIQFQARKNDEEESDEINIEGKSQDMLLFAKSAWIATNNGTLAGKSMPPYVWMNPNKKPVEGEFLQLNENIVISKSGTLMTSEGDDGLYKFNDLGNYEIVCFWGSETMSKIRNQFLWIRPKMTPGQRQFKFHYYNISQFVHPDTEWTDTQKAFCRKCKHILVSVDELNPSISSQSVYKDQITVFVNHLQQLMNDTTFPIWIFTMNESPITTKNCFTDRFLPRTTDHPCNDVLKYLFERKTYNDYDIDSTVDGSKNKDKNNIFPDRIHLLDNTDLTLPRSGDDVSTINSDNLDVLSNIAMRIYVLVGKGVSDWRAIGQRGLPDGLHKNFEAIIEPNFELTPYTGWI